MRPQGDGRAHLGDRLDAAEAWYRQCNYGWVDSGMALDIRTGQDWIAIGGRGMLESVMLAEAAYELGEASR